MSKPAFDPSKPFEATDAGSKPAFDPSKPFEAADSGGDQKSAVQQLADQFNVFGRKGLSSISLGATEPVFSGLNAGVAQAQKAFSGEGIEALAPSNLKKAYDSDIEYHKKLYAENPIPAVTGEITGAFTPGGLAQKLYGGVSKVVGAKALQMGIGASAAPGASALNRGLAEIGKIGQAGLEGLGGSATTVLAQNKILQASGFQDPKDAASPIDAGVFGFGMGASLRAAPAIAQGVGASAKWAGQKAMTSVLGPKGEAISAYLARPMQINNVKELGLEGVKNAIDHEIAGFNKLVESAKLSKDEAQQAVRLLEQKITDAAKQAGLQHRLKNADIKATLQDAKARLNDKYNFEVEKLKAIKSPIQISDDVTTAVQDLKQRVTNGSNESYAILDADKTAYSVRGAARLLRAKADEMNIQPWVKDGATGGTALAPRVGHTPGAGMPSGPVTDETRGVQAQLHRFADLLEQTPEMIPAREIKKILQQIDKSDKAKYGDPGFDSRVSEAYKFIRGTIDQAVKDRNPAYRAKMEEVARDMNLFERSLDRFRDPRSTVSRLNSINARTAGEDQKLLAELGQATGRDFVTPIQQFSQAQTTLADPRALDKIKRGLPEYKETRLKGMELARNQRPDAQGKFVEQSTQGLAAERAAAEGSLAQKIKEFEEAQAKLTGFDRLSQLNSQSSIKSLMRAPGQENIETRKALEALSKASGKDFVQMVDDLRVANNFNGEYRNGARNTVLGATFGFALTQSPYGASIGASIGGVVDRFGPQIAQKVLDGVLKVEKSTAGISKALSKISTEADVSQFIRPQTSFRPVAEPAAALQNQAGSSVISRRMERLRGTSTKKPSVNE